jgi:hypothetical protein
MQNLFGGMKVFFITTLIRGDNNGIQKPEFLLPELLLGYYY